MGLAVHRNNKRPATRAGRLPESEHLEMKQEPVEMLPSRCGSDHRRACAACGSLQRSACAGQRSRGLVRRCVGPDVRSARIARRGRRPWSRPSPSVAFVSGRRRSGGGSGRSRIVRPRTPLQCRSPCVQRGRPPQSRLLSLRSFLPSLLSPLPLRRQHTPLHVVIPVAQVNVRAIVSRRGACKSTVCRPWTL